MARPDLKKELNEWISEDKISKNSINTQLLKLLKEELRVNKRLEKRFKVDFGEFFGK